MQARGQVIEAEEPIGLSVVRANPSLPTSGSDSSFRRTLTWGDGGAYTITGTLRAACTTVSGRMTTWLEYGSTSESWKETAEIECTDDTNTGPLEVDSSGTVRSGEQLEVRLATWKIPDFPVIYEYSDRLRFTPPGA